MKRWFGAVVLSAMLSVACVAQGNPELKVEFQREGVPVPHWKLTFFHDGSGVYEGWPSNFEAVKREFKLSAETWAQVQGLMQASKGMQPCETRTKGLARVGQKSVEYSPADGPVAHCSFNYTDNKPLAEAATLWVGMATTLDEGRRIANLHKHDRLGLDKELTDYQRALENGMAGEPRLIAEELQALVEDTALMDRVRARAQQILEMKVKKQLW